MIVSAPPLLPELTVTFAVAVVDPEEFVAVSVYVVVAVGLTEVEPVALVEVNEPGVMAMLVALLTDQERELLEPELMDVGFAPKELMVGLLEAGLTVMVTVCVAEPAELVAVSVYVVVAVGETEVEPLAWVEVKEPGVMAMLRAPEVDQLSVVLLPDVMVEGLAPKEEIAGTGPPVPPPPWEPEPLLTPAQPLSRSSAKRSRISRTMARIRLRAERLCGGAEWGKDTVCMSNEPNGAGRKCRRRICAAATGRKGKERAVASGEW